jgi:nitronate monooxygenase
MHAAAKQFCSDLNIDLPILGGAMYPCSNPELVAAISEAGGLGIIQPLSLTYVHGHDFREGIRLIRRLTSKPIGLNLLIEKSSQRYLDRVKEWLDIGLEEGIGFFVTALGNPRSVCDVVHAHGGLVYHNTTSHKWAEKALDGGVDGLICVNDRAGGHAGTESAIKLYHDLVTFDKPLVSAGGLSNPQALKEMLDLGYAGIQMGTRFIASAECTANSDYKQAIVNSTEKDIVLTDKLSGVPVSIIETDFIKRSGALAGPLARRLLQGSKTKRYMRLYYTLRSFRALKKSVASKNPYDNYLQAGKSVEGIHEILPVAEIMAQYAKILGLQSGSAL